MARRKVSVKVLNTLGRLAATNSERYHVMPRSNNWIVKRDGAVRAIGIYSSKNEAVKKVRNVIKTSKSAYAYIHGRDGRIQEEVTYFGG